MIPKGANISQVRFSAKGFAVLVGAITLALTAFGIVNTWVLPALRNFVPGYAAATGGGGEFDDDGGL